MSGPMPTSRRAFMTGAAAVSAMVPLGGRTAWAAEAPQRRLVPREVFFGDPDKTWARLSADGVHLAYIAPMDGVRNLWVAPLDDLAAGRPVTRATDRPISNYYRWAFSHRHLVFFQERQGDENWRASSVDIQTGAI